MSSDTDHPSDEFRRTPGAGSPLSRRVSLDLEPAPGPGGILIVRLHGACNGTFIQFFRHTLETLLIAGFTRVVLDLTDLRALNPRGAGSLRCTASRARALGGKVVLLCSPEYWRAHAHLRNLEGVVLVLSSEEEAVASLRCGSAPGPPPSEYLAPE